jgi:protein arginine kinase
MTGEDGEKVLSLVFDAFAHLEDSHRYQPTRVDCISPLRQKLLVERGLLSSIANGVSNTAHTSANGSGDSANIVSAPSARGIVLSGDGRVVCTINDRDHLRISAYAPGLNTDEVWQLCHGLEEELQGALQFAASYDVGYLTHSLFDAGSGMKVSIHAHLPAIELAGTQAHTEFLKGINQRGFVAETYYGLKSNNLPFGSYYRIRNASAASGNEFDQLAAFTACAHYIAGLERKFRLEAASHQPTILRDRVYRAFGAIKYSRFLEERESIGLLSDIKLGLDTGILRPTGEKQSGLPLRGHLGSPTATEFATQTRTPTTGAPVAAIGATSPVAAPGATAAPISITGLFYRIKSAHLEMIIHSGHFAFEPDVAASEKLQVLRIRSLVIQEALEGLRL